MDRIKIIIATIILAVVVMLALMLPFSPLYVGYMTGTQGLEAQFNSIYYKRYWYDGTHGGPNPQYNNSQASAYEFFDRVNFDPDGAATLHPNLKASMQPITVDTDVDPKRYTWSLQVDDVLQGNTTYAVYHEYEMLRYRCSWSVNLWLDGPEAESWGGVDQAYNDAQLWIRLQPKSFVYFEENPDEVYFAPAYIGLAENAQWGHYNEAGEYEADPPMGDQQDIFPEAKGEVLGIFYQQGGAPVEMEDELLAFQGQPLDPQVFRDEYWVRLGIDNFHTVSWHKWGVLEHHWHQPSVRLTFLVYVFVVGQWTVMLETGEIPALEPHQSTYSQGGGDLLKALSDWWGDVITSPFTYIWTFIIIIIVVLIVIAIVAIFAPGFLSAVGSWIRRE